MRWFNRVLPYIKNQQVFTCPSFGRDTFTGTNWRGWPVPSNWVGISVDYGISSGISPNPWGAGQVSLSELTHPAETVYFGDAMHEYVNGAAQFAAANECGGTPGCGCGGSSHPANPNYARHSGGSNLAFADGHVKWASFGTIIGTWSLWGVR